MGMIQFFNTAVPETMAPLTCMENLLVMELGAGTMEETLKRRWTPVAAMGDIEVSAAFWPSAELIEKLAACQAFVLSDKDGNAVARRNGASPAAVTADDASFVLRYPWDVLKVNEEYLSTLKTNDIKGQVRELAVLDGVVILGEGSVILPGVYIEGVAVIGKNCKIGPNCYLRGNTFIGDKCHIGQAVEIKNALLMHHVAAGHLSYLGDSVICPDVNFGAGTISSNFRHDGKNHRSMIGNTLVDTGRRKFGTIIGSNVHTGIHTAIYPGRKIWAGMSTRPGDVVQRDLRKMED